MKLHKGLKVDKEACLTLAHNLKRLDDIFEEGLTVWVTYRGKRLPLSVWGWSKFLVTGKKDERLKVLWECLCYPYMFDDEFKGCGYTREDITPHWAAAMLEHLVENREVNWIDTLPIGTKS